MMGGYDALLLIGFGFGGGFCFGLLFEAARNR